MSSKGFSAGELHCKTRKGISRVSLTSAICRSSYPRHDPRGEIWKIVMEECSLNLQANKCEAFVGFLANRCEAFVGFFCDSAGILRWTPPHLAKYPRITRHFPPSLHSPRIHVAVHFRLILEETQTSNRKSFVVPLVGADCLGRIVEIIHIRISDWQAFFRSALRTHTLMGGQCQNTNEPPVYGRQQEEEERGDIDTAPAGGLPPWPCTRLASLPAKTGPNRGPRRARWARSLTPGARRALPAGRPRGAGTGRTRPGPASSRSRGRGSSAR